MKEYCEQLHTKKLDDVEEMEEFLKRHELLKLTQEMYNLNRPIQSEEMDL